MILPMQIEITGAVPSKFTVNDYSEDCVKVSGLVSFAQEDGGIGRGAETFNYKTSSAINDFKNLGLEKGSMVFDCRVEYVKRGKKAVMILREIDFKSGKPVSSLSTNSSTK